MASVGFQGAYGQQAMADQVRQRIMDELSQAKDAHTMGIQDAELKLRQDEAANNTADRAQLRQQQGQGFNEKLAEGIGTNLGPGQTVISPELAQRFTNTTLAPLVKPDQTLPSTSMAGAAGLAGAPAPDVASSVTQNAPKLTGQLRFMGTPAQNMTQQIMSSPAVSPTQKLAFGAENAGLKVPPNVFEQKDTSALDAARIQSLTANAERAAQAAQMAGATAEAKSAAAQAQLALKQAQFEFAQKQAEDKAGAWAPTGDTAIDPSGNPSFVFRNGKGEVKYVAAPPGLKIEKPAPGGGIGDWWRSTFGPSETSAPKRIVYGTDGKPIS